MSLQDRLKADILAGGPMGIDRFMAACLYDSKDGYYATRPALGARGDFLTAPMVSQMFGEIIGAWAVEIWRRLARPTRVLLAELGPGDGSLMADALRAARLDPEFLAAAEVWLIEVSEPLARLQRTRLAGPGVVPRWGRALAELPTDAPLILIANEVLDCLPTRQFVRLADGWAERAVGLDDAGDLCFGLAPRGADSPGGLDGLATRPGQIIETSPAQYALAADIAHRLLNQRGAALLIDYGEESGSGDTLQAVMAHAKLGPLERPGEADLTVHADFRAVRAAAAAEGVSLGLTTQGAFLRRLGIEARAAALSAARPDQAPVIARQLARLADADQMGTLFKAACLYPPGPPPPGFEDTP